MYSALRHSLLAVLQLPLFILSELYYTTIIIRRYKIDLIHSHWFVPSGLVGAAGAFILRKPLVISSHVLDTNLFEKFRFFIPILSAIAGSADLITTNSSYTKKMIESRVRLQCPCKVIPMGVNPGTKSPDKKGSGECNILFVGRLIEWKGVDTLIHAMTRVSMSIPGSRLTIVGEGPLRDSLQRLVQDAGLVHTVRFCGRVSDEDLVKVYNTATVFVLPSRSYQGLVMEGLGVVLLEAMSHGVPVIGSNVGGIPDIIDDGKNGFLFPSDDEDYLADKIKELLSDSELAERFRQAGYQTVQTRFSWEQISRQFADSYNFVLDQHSGNGAA
jgi:glycosyltransferase involved in cell wall biosynthesis